MLADKQPLVQIAKTVKSLCKVHSMRLMIDKCTAGLSFLEKVDHAISGQYNTLEKAKIQQMLAQMHMTRTNQLERKVKNAEVMLTHAQSALSIIEQVLGDG